MKDDKKEKSYFALERHRRKRNLMIIVPIVAMSVCSTSLGLFFMSNSSINANHMVLHNHVRLNVTPNGQSVIVPAHIGMTMVEKMKIH